MPATRRTRSPTSATSSPAPGWAFASINYRLADESTGAADGRYPAAERDVAAALAFLQDRSGANRTDPDRLLLLGHSAGAFLVSLVGTDGRHLATAGLGLDDIACVASNDTSYDIPREVAAGGTQAAMFRNAFGDDPAVWREASPSRNVAAGKGIPDFHVITRGTTHRVAEATSFVDRARRGRCARRARRGPGHEPRGRQRRGRRSRRHPHHPRPHGLLPHLRLMHGECRIRG